MRIKNFELLKSIVHSCGDNLIDLVEVGELTELQVNNLIKIIEIDKSVNRLQKLKENNAEFQFLNIGGMRERNISLSNELLELTPTQVTRICYEYTMIEDEFKKIFE